MSVVSITQITQKIIDLSQPAIAPADRIAETVGILKTFIANCPQ
ncbi:hypothetical protein [Microcoleus vaginatus]